MSCGLLPDFPHAIKYNTPLCPIAYPNWKYDVHRQDFCNKWGHFAPHLRERPCNPCIDLHIPMSNFDKFSKAPLFQTSKCSTKFRYQRKAFDKDQISCCSRPNLRSAYNCPDPSSMINQVYYPNDVVCGNCPSPGQDRQRFFNYVGKNDLSHCDVVEFPFEIFQCPDVAPKPMKIKSGSERCLAPSSMRYLQTTNQADLRDFYRTKKKCEIELYRTRLAIDNRRKKPTIPCDDEQGTVIKNGCPITVNAKVAKWKGGNLRPTYDILFPSTLTLEKLDFSVGSLDNLPSNCKPMAVIS